MVFSAPNCQEFKAASTLCRRSGSPRYRYSSRMSVRQQRPEPSHAARPTKSTTTVMRLAPTRSAAAEMVAIPLAAVALDAHPLPLVRTRTMTPAMTTETQPSTHCCVCSSDAGCPRPIRPFGVLWSQGRSEVQVRQNPSPAQVTNII